MASLDKTLKNIEPAEGCIANAMRVLGLKWSALILGDLNNGPKRFCELERSIERITPRILSQRLNDLEALNIICQNDGSYRLTDKGKDLMPTLIQMASWGSKYPA
ncbi:MAG: winged helix-turn-helix transcriptional regulator [Candidatus Saccharimonadales bacterium]